MPGQRLVQGRLASWGGWIKAKSVGGGAGTAPVGTTTGSGEVATGNGKGDGQDPATGTGVGVQGGVWWVGGGRGVGSVLLLGGNPLGGVWT